MKEHQKQENVLKAKQPEKKNQIIFYVDRK